MVYNKNANAPKPSTRPIARAIVWKLPQSCAIIPQMGCKYSYSENNYVHLYGPSCKKML